MKIENNWKDKIIELLKKDTNTGQFEIHGTIEEVVSVILEFGNLVFEATKKECADKAAYNIKEDAVMYVPYKSISINKESILNIQKPNL
jgi:hypothetical protein